MSLKLAGSNGRVGKRLCVIHPALSRKSGTEQADIVLTKAIILVAFDLPIGCPQNITEHPKVEVKIGAGRHEGETEAGRDAGKIWGRVSPWTVKRDTETAS